MGWGGGKTPGQVFSSGQLDKNPGFEPKEQAGGAEGPGPPRTRMSTASGLIFSIWLKH